MPSTQTEIVMIRLAPDLKEWVQIRADAEDRSMNSFIRRLLQAERARQMEQKEPRTDGRDN